jgi:hypothetical protein
MPKEAIIRWSRWRNGIFAAGGTITVMLIFLFHSRNHLILHDDTAGFGLVVATVVFVVGSLILFRNALDRRPQLVIFKRGISQQEKRVRFIPWSNIASCRPLTLKYFKALVLVLNEDIRDGHRKTSFWSGLLMKLDRKLAGGPAIVIRTSGYDMTHAQICELVEQWIAYGQRYD